VHEHRLALLQPAPAVQREVGGVVVHDEPGSLLHREGLREGNRHRRVGDGAVGEAAEGKRHDALARLESGTVGCRRDRAGHLRAQREGKVRLDLILPAGEQEIGEGEAAGVHVDHHTLAQVRLRRVLDHGHAVGSGELFDLQGAHAGANANDQCSPPRYGRFSAVCGRSQSPIPDRAFAGDH
jgi:hypothetical protein